MQSMVTLAIANHKGGVGKTATAQALGVILAREGIRVLLVDADPQASLTQSFGLGDTAGRSMAEVLGGSRPGSLPIEKILLDLGNGLYMAPADILLAATELGLTSRLGRESVLKKALKTISDRFDLVLIDCPPSLGLLSVGALVAADAVLIPTQPQAVDLRGLRIFLDTIDQIKNELNPKLEILGVLVTFYDRRLNHHQAAVKAMNNAGLPLIGAKIGRSVRVAEAASAGQSVTEFEPNNPRAQEYKDLAAEVRKWQKSKTG